MKDYVSTHYQASVRLFHDQSDIGSAEDIAAMVASGDTFVTLATAIEEISQELPATAQAAASQLERLAVILFYMQRYYKVTRKKPDHRGGIY